MLIFVEAHTALQRRQEYGGSSKIVTETDRVEFANKYRQ